MHHDQQEGQVQLDFSPAPQLKAGATFREARAFCRDLYRQAVEHMLDDPDELRGENPYLGRIWEIAYRFRDEHPYRPSREFRPAPIDYFDALTHRHTEGTLTAWTRVSRALIQAVTRNGELVIYKATLKVFGLGDSGGQIDVNCPCEGGHHVTGQREDCGMPGAITPTGYRSVSLGRFGPAITRANAHDLGPTLCEWLQGEVDKTVGRRQTRREPGRPERAAPPPPRRGMRDLAPAASDVPEVGL